MLAWCRARAASLGIARIDEKVFADIGCTAEIVSIVKEYPDGRLDIISEGRKRFEVLRVNQERSFLRAETILLEDEAGAAVAHVSTRAVQLHAEILELAGAMQALSATTRATFSMLITVTFRTVRHFQ